MPHGHALAFGAYVVAWLILANFWADALAGGFPRSTAARALHQSV